MIGKPLDTFTDVFRRLIIHRDQNLIPGIGAVHKQRDIKIGNHVILDINGVKTVIEKREKFLCHHGTLRQCSDIFNKTRIGKIRNVLLPNRIIKHANHSRVIKTKLVKIKGIETRKHIPEKNDPTPGVNGTKPHKSFSQNRRRTLVKGFARTGCHSAIGKAIIVFIKGPDINMIIIQKIRQGQGLSRLFGEGTHSPDKSGFTVRRFFDVFQYIVLRFFLKQNIAAFGHIDKTVFDLLRHAAAGV